MKNVKSGIITTILGIALLIFDGVLFFVETEITVEPEWMGVIMVLGVLLILAPDDLRKIIRKRIEEKKPLKK